MKATRRISVCNNGWLFPKMKYLVNELQKNNIECSENCFNRMNTDVRLEENHDCGYQSSTSKWYVELLLSIRMKKNCIL